MTALIIIIAVIMLIVLAVNIPVTAYIKFYDGKADIKVKFLFKQLYPKIEKAEQHRGKEEKPEKRTKKAKSNRAEVKAAAEKSDEMRAEAERNKSEPESGKRAAPEEKASGDDLPQRQGLLERISAKLDELNEKKTAVLLGAELIKEPLKRLCGKLSIDDLTIDFAAANEDAYEAAMLYGKANAAVYNALSAVRCFVPVSVTRINIDCLFNTPADKCRWNGECSVRLRPASVINAVIAVIFGYIRGKEKYSPVMALFK